MFVQELIGLYEKKGRPMYLETSMDKNLPFYKKFGFDVFQTVQLSYTIYQLRRV